MCLIILRKPNQHIDFEKFKTACMNNPDGFGLSFPEGDGVRLNTLRSAKPSDPEYLYKLMQEDLKDESIMVHLRYTTAGETSLRNAHPFPILERKQDGEDLRMAHNGTIYKWKNNSNRNKWESDTRVFVRGFVRPLFKRLARGMYAEDILGDSFSMDLLQDQIPTTSVLTFLAADGTFGLVNETGNGGFWEDGVYYSNKYSFNSSHRTQKDATTIYYPSKSKTSAYSSVWEETLEVGDYVYIPGSKGEIGVVVSLALGWAEVASLDGENQDAYTEDSLTKASDAAVKYFKQKSGFVDKPVVIPVEVITEEDTSEVAEEEEAQRIEELQDILQDLDVDAAMCLTTDDIGDLVDKFPEDFALKLLDIIAGMVYNKIPEAKKGNALVVVQ